MTPAGLPSTATKIAVAPSRRSSSALGAERGRRRRRARPGTRALPSATRRPSTVPSTPLPVGRVEVADAARARCRARSARRDDRGGQRMLARPLDAGGQAQQLVLVEARRRRRPPSPSGLPSVSVPVLSTTSVSTFSMRSSASAFLISTPACAPRPTPTMIDIGVASPSAQGQAMISTDDGRDQRVGEARLRPADAQATKASDRDRDHGRHEPAATPDRPGAGSARGCAAPRRPSARCAPAWCRGRPARPA